MDQRYACNPAEKFEQGINKDTGPALRPARYQSYTSNLLKYDYYANGTASSNKPLIFIRGNVFLVAVGIDIIGAATWAAVNCAAFGVFADSAVFACRSAGSGGRWLGWLFFAAACAGVIIAGACSAGIYAARCLIFAFGTTATEFGTAGIRAGFGSFGIG